VGTSTEMGRAKADVFADKQVTVVSVFQRKIMTIVQYTVSFSLIMVVSVLLVQGLARNQPWDEAVLAALVILIASIPIALPLVMQVVMALGAAYLAKEHHAIITSIPALQDIASMSILCSVSVDSRLLDASSILLVLEGCQGLRTRNETNLAFIFVAHFLRIKPERSLRPTCPLWPIASLL